MGHRGFLSAALLACLLSASGCSVYMAATAPPKRDTNVVHLGTTRQQLLSEFGTPNQTRTTEEGHLEDTWTFRQGDSTGWKVSRALFHGAADVFTIGMWEVVGTPTEMLLKEDETTFSVVYDKNERAVYIASAGGEMGHVEMGQKPQPAAMAAAPTSMTASPDDRTAEARLTDLKQLYDQGQITKQEYDTKRAAIVGGI